MMPQEPRDTPQGMVAAVFARALVDAQFDAAFGMLSASLQASTSPAQLKAELDAMVQYGLSPPNFVDVITVLDDWRGRQERDIGWAYAAINGEGFCEAVAVVVAQEAGRHVIREMEWGRP